MSEAADSGAPKKSGAGKLILFIVLGILALGGAGAGGYFFFAASQADDAAQSEDAGSEDDAEGSKGEKSNAKKKKKKPTAPAVYVKLDPALVVNSEDGGLMRFLQVGVEMSTRDPLTADALKVHEPAIRNDLLLLLTSRPLSELKTREGKDKLRADALEVVKTIIENEGGSGASVEAIFFTSFVMQ